MPKGEQDHRAVAMAVAVALAGGRHESLDLPLGEILAGAVVRVRTPATSNCPVYSARCADVGCRVHRHFSQLCTTNYPDNSLQCPEQIVGNAYTFRPRDISAITV